MSPQFNFIDGGRRFQCVLCNAITEVGVKVLLLSWDNFKAKHYYYILYLLVKSEDASVCFYYVKLNRFDDLFE